MKKIFSPLRKRASLLVLRAPRSAQDVQGCIKMPRAQGLQRFQGPFKPLPLLQHHLTFTQTSASCKLSAIMHQ